MLVLLMHIPLPTTYDTVAICIYSVECRRLALFAEGLEVPQWIGAVLGTSAFFMWRADLVQLSHQIDLVRSRSIIAHVQPQYPSGTDPYGPHAVACQRGRHARAA